MLRAIVPETKVRLIPSLLFFAFSLPLYGSDFCEKFENNAKQEEVYLRTPGKIYAITNVEKSNLHSAPHNSCKLKGIYLGSRDKVMAYTEYNGFFSIMLVSDDGTTIEGWVKINKLTETLESVSSGK